MEWNRRPLRDLLTAPDERPRGIDAKTYRRREHRQRHGEAHGCVLPSVCDGCTRRRSQRVMFHSRSGRRGAQCLVTVRGFEVPGDGAADNLFNRRRGHPARVHRPNFPIDAAAHHHRARVVERPVAREHHPVLVLMHDCQYPLVRSAARVVRIGHVCRRVILPRLPGPAHVHRNQPRADGADEHGGVKPG